MIKAHEIQGVLALENSFNRVGLDHVLLVKVASTAVVAAMLGLSQDEIVNAVSHAWVDGAGPAHLPPCAEHRLAQELGGGRRHRARRAPRADGPTGEMGYPSALTATTWGFYDVLFQGHPFDVARPYGSYVMENVLFKIQLPGRVPRADRRRVRDRAASARARPARRRSPRSRSARTNRRCGSSTRRARSPIRPTATIAFSTWWPCR